MRVEVESCEFVGKNMSQIGFIWQESEQRGCWQKVLDRAEIISKSIT